MEFSRRLPQLRQAVEDSLTVAQFNHRKEIYERILSYAETGEYKSFRLKLWNDYPAWCAYYITTDTGLPFFPTRWQIEKYHKFSTNLTSWFMEQRRAGKTAGAATILLYTALRQPEGYAEHILIFGPTEDQLEVMENIRFYMAQDSAKELYSEFIGEHVNKNSKDEPGSSDRLGTVFNKEYIRFKNGSDIEGKNLNIQKKSDTKRGASATILVIDERQLVPSDIMNKVVYPVIMDSHNARVKKRLLMLSTPSEIYDPDLGRKWEKACASGTVGTIHSHCWDAVKHGIRTPEKMKERFEELLIPCDYVLKNGICPVYLPEMYAEKTGAPAPKHETCPCGSRANDAYVQEDLAEFPQFSNLGIPVEWIRQAVADYGPTHPDALEKGKTYIMSIDMGDISADTQICVWELMDTNVQGYAFKSLKLRYQEIVNDPRKVGIKNPSGKRIQELYWKVQPYKILVDVTGKKDIIVDLVMGEQKIPLHAFIINETAEKNSAIGIWCNGPNKADLMNNLRERLRGGCIIIPSRDRQFYEKFEHQLKGLQPKPATQTRSYIHWGETLHVTDAVALGAWYLKLLEDDRLRRVAYAGPVFMNDGDLPFL